MAKSRRQCIHFFFFCLSRNFCISSKFLRTTIISLGRHISCMIKKVPFWTLLGEGSPGRLFYGNRILPPGMGALTEHIDCHERLRNHSLTQLKLFYLQLTTFLSRTAASIFGAEAERSYIFLKLKSFLTYS